MQCVLDEVSGLFGLSEYEWMISLGQLLETLCSRVKNVTYCVLSILSVRKFVSSKRFTGHVPL